MKYLRRLAAIAVAIICVPLLIIAAVVTLVSYMALRVSLSVTFGALLLCMIYLDDHEETVHE